MPELTVGYVIRMEEVLRVLEKPWNPLQPVVSLDEKPMVLRQDARPGKPMSPSHPVAKRDYEYVRKGSVNVFVVFEPKTGRHTIRPTPNRKGPAFAKMLRLLAAQHPEARTIHLIADNLNTHSKTSLIKAFGKVKGAALWGRFTLHFTPIHGSWLNPAENAIGRLVSEAIGKRRIGSLKELQRVSRAWEGRVNRERRPMQWIFNRHKARRCFGYEGLFKKRSRH